MVREFVEGSPSPRRAWAEDEPGSEAALHGRRSNERKVHGPSAEGVRKPSALSFAHRRERKSEALQNNGGDFRPGSRRMGLDSWDRMEA